MFRGILTVRADRVNVRDNKVVGMSAAASPSSGCRSPNPDPRVDPFPDGNRVVGNVALANGLSPDPLRSPYPGADLIYDGTGSGTCFGDSVCRELHPTGTGTALRLPG